MDNCSTKYALITLDFGITSILHRFAIFFSSWVIMYALILANFLESLKHYMNLNILATPVRQQLEYIDTIPTGDRCYDLEFCDENLYVATDDGIRMYSPYSNSYKTISNRETTCTSVTNVPGKRGSVYALIFGAWVHRSTKSIYEISKISHSGLFPTQTKLFSYTDKDNVAHFISATDSRIVAGVGKKLKIFDLKTKTQKEIEIKFFPDTLHFISDDLLLVAGTDSRIRLLLLKQDSEHMDIVWTTTVLAGLAGVCRTEQGLIVVRSRTEAAIHILSPMGMLPLLEWMLLNTVSVYTCTM